MNKQPAYRSTAGFTLIELLTAIVIASILALIAAPGWLNFMNNRRANAGREQILQFLRQAQTQARQTRQDQVVAFLKPAGELPIVKVGSLSQRLDGQTTGNQLNAKSMGLEVLRGTDSNCSSALGCIVFDDRGNIKNELGDNGIVITVTSPTGNNSSKRCVIVQSILGAMRNGIGDECQ